MMKRRFVRAIISAVMVVLTVLAIHAIQSLPFSHGRDKIVDALSLPGGLIASTLYPQGIHTNGGSSLWPWFAVLFNWLIYWVVWFVVLTMGSQLLPKLKRSKGK
jgi:hypothetical protein